FPRFLSTCHSESASGGRRLRDASNLVAAGQALWVSTLARCLYLVPGHAFYLVPTLDIVCARVRFLKVARVIEVEMKKARIKTNSKSLSFFGTTLAKTRQEWSTHSRWKRQEN